MRAAFFDLDKTVIAKSSLVALGPEFHARGLLHRRTLVWAVISQMLFLRFGADDAKLDKIRQSVLKVIKGWDRDEVRVLVENTINEVIEPLIYDEAIGLIDEHLANGDEVYLVSTAPEEVVAPFAELLGLTGCIASIAHVDDEGKYTGEMEFFARGENKAVAIRALAQRRGIDLADSFAYSDSETDAPMLLSVGHACAVNPDRALARLAEEHDWPVLSFTTKVRAHDRARSRTPFVVSAMIIGAAARMDARLRQGSAST
ncbi:MAG: HAD family hydrolase, partial [Acidimicrobiales bacterium]